MLQKTIFPPFVVALVLTLVLCAGNQNVLHANDKRPKLTIGSKAPAIKITHWLSIPEGFEKVQRFKKGNIYVVEFWATWCGPCRRAIPHVSELAEKYREQGVQFIGVSDESLDKVKSFLAKKVNKESEETFQDFTSKYCLTCDPDGSVKKQIFRAAGRTGIPCAFVIGKGGIVEWIGFPTKIDKPLQQIIDGTWDRKSFKLKFERDYRMKRNKKTVGDLIKKEKHNLTASAIKKILPDCEGKELRNWQIKLIEVCVTNNLKRAEKEFKAIAAEHYTDPVMMNQMAWTVVEASQNGTQVKSEVLALARKASDLSVKSNRTAAALDTLAHVLELQGELDSAIEIQSEAVKVADDKLRPNLEQYLKALRNAKD